MFGVVAARALGAGGGLARLVLGDLVHHVLVALVAVRVSRLGGVHLQPNGSPSCQNAHRAIIASGWFNLPFEA